MIDTSSTQLNQEDWFLLRDSSHASATTYLNDVLTQLTCRHNFLQALTKHLTPRPAVEWGHDASDAISWLGAGIKMVENTVNFRLELLKPDRMGPWFRKPIGKSAGPFGSRILDLPIFAPHAVTEGSRMRLELINTWLGKADVSPFTSVPCIWNTLIALNQERKRLALLSYDGICLQLDKVPLHLSREVQSPTLVRFLESLVRELTTAKLRLDNTFDQLLRASERFWQHHRRVHEHTGRQSHGTGRRSTDRTAEKDALAFFGFADYPSKAQLRRRYLDLAKKLHPDVNDGFDADFKKLTNWYEKLQRSCHE